MLNRFNSIGLNVIFTPEVDISDDRLKLVFHKRVSAIMLQHLDSIKHFYENTNFNNCIICEDDIHISKHLQTQIPIIVNEFNEMKLDVLMLGFLWPFKDLNSRYFSSIKKGQFNYFTYNDDIWGTQMYMISRSYAEFLLNTYNIQWCIENLDKPYSPDWILTKNGNRALIWPMLAVEEGVSKASENNQITYHQRCHDANFVSNIFI